MAADPLTFVCPACRHALEMQPDAFRCARCARIFPVVCGIPDFRLRDDPYISIEADRQKALRLAEQGRTRTLEALIDHYYSITPDDPPDRAVRWKAHALAAVEIAAVLVDDAGVMEPAAGSGALLDIGCGTGGLLVAAHRRWRVVGVDIALRWLIVAQVRLRAAGIHAPLVCAGADSLPFEDATFQLVTCIDVIEHVPDAVEALREAHRVSAPGALTLVTANNRYVPREPNLGIWGVGPLPRRWQAGYVAWRRPDVNRYTIRLPSARELDRGLRTAGYRQVRTEPDRLIAPERSSVSLQRVLAAYNTVRRWPVFRSCLRVLGPRLRSLARRE